MGSTSTVRT